MPTIIVEDGTGVPNANSYVDVAYARTFADDVGLVFPSDDDALARLLLGSMAYIEAQPFQGFASTPTQSLQWPRTGVFVNGYAVPSNTIPIQLKQAQVQAAFMVSEGTDLNPTIDAGLITKETVGPIETDYSEEYLATYDGLPIFSAIVAYLRPLLISKGGYKLSPAFGF